MVLFRVFVAIVWLIAVLNFSVRFLYEEPMGAGGWFVIGASIVFTTLKLIEDAIDAADGLRDSEPQI